MKIFLVVFAFIVSSFNFLVEKVNTFMPTPRPVSTSLTATPTVSPTPTPGLFTHAPKPTSPSITPTSTPSFNISEYIYPGAQVVSSSGNNLSLQSSNDPNSIIDWYEARLNIGFSSRSDSVTNTNGNVSGTIYAGDGSRFVNITIHKNNKELYTSIEVKIKSP